MQARAHLAEQGLAEGPLRDAIVSCLYKKAEAVCRDVVRLEEPKYNEKQLKIDRILTSKWTGIPIMLALLAAVFWITITGANYPFRAVEPWFVLGTGPPDGSVCVPSCAGLAAWGAGAGRIPGAGVGGIRDAVPPMAIFFPLFTLLEDLGYLPRVAFNLDKHFQKMPGLRQTGAYHVHGVWVQRSRHCGVPHHRFSARTAHCHFDQQFCALQRPFPDVLPKGKKKNGFMYCQDMFKIVYFLFLAQY